MTETVDPDRRTATATENRILLFTKVSSLLLIVCGTMLWYAFTTIKNDIQVNGGFVTGMRISLAEIAEHIRHDKTEKAGLTAMILRNAEGIRLLRTQKNARYDAFTGRNGRELERRIEILEGNKQ